MSDLDALMEWAATERPETEDAVRDLVDEIRHLRADVGRVESWIETWERESVERGPGDKIYSAGAAALLRLAIRKPARPLDGRESREAGA